MQTYIKTVFAPQKSDYGKPLYSTIEQKEICTISIGSLLLRDH